MNLSVASKYNKRTSEATNLHIIRSV